MNPAGNVITNRYVRHFNLVYIEPYSDTSLSSIFVNVMEWMYRSQGKNPYPDGCIRLKENIVTATINVYNQVQ
jgi:dynein heavy chain, axonemal